MKKIILILTLLLMTSNVYASNTNESFINSKLYKILENNNYPIINMLSNNDVIARDVRVYSYSETNSNMELSMKVSMKKSDCKYIKKESNANLISLDEFKKYDDYYNDIIKNCKYSDMGLVDVNSIIRIFGMPYIVEVHNGALADLVSENMVIESFIGTDYCDLYCNYTIKQDNETFLNILKANNKYILNDNIYDFKHSIETIAGATYISVLDAYEITNKDKDYFDSVASNKIINIKNIKYISVRDMANKIFSDKCDVIYNSDTNNITLIY